MAVIKFTFNLLITLATLHTISCQLAGIATSLPPIISLMDNLTDISPYMPQLAALLKDQKAEQLITNHKQDEIINLLQNQQETQNETAVTQQQMASSQVEMTNTLNAIASTQSQMVATQNQTASSQEEMTNTLNAIASTQSQMATTQNQTASSQVEMTNTLNAIASTQSQMVATQNQMAATQSQMASTMNQMVSLLQKHDQQLENITAAMTSMVNQQNTQNQILSTVASLLQSQNDSMQKLIHLQELQLEIPNMRQPPSTIEPTTQDVTDSPNQDITTQPTAQDCEDILNQGYTENYGIYTITPDNLTSFQVSCDLQTEGGGWTVFQRRFDGSVDFYRGWEDYKNGFGDLDGEHWLALEKIHRLTSSSNEVWQLRIELEDFEGNTAYAQYDNFVIGNETTYYRLGLGAYNGTAGDSLAWNVNKAFSTYDQDHDIWSNNCAQSYHGAWWYRACAHSNLNGLYVGSPEINIQGMTWWYWKGSYEVLKKAEMKMRRM